MRFAELTERQIKVIETLEIGRTVISDEHSRIIRNILNLEGKSEDELRAIRNSCVKHLGDKFEEAPEDFRAGLRLITNMSGVTAVIDSQLWQIGVEV